MTAGEMARRKISRAMLQAMRFADWLPCDPDIKAPRLASFYACARRGLLTDTVRGWRITDAGREALRAIEAGR